MHAQDQVVQINASIDMKAYIIPDMRNLALSYTKSSGWGMICYQVILKIYHLRSLSTVWRSARSVTFLELSGINSIYIWSFLLYIYFSYQ